MRPRLRRKFSRNLPLLILTLIILLFLFVLLDLGFKKLSSFSPLSPIGHFNLYRKDSIEENVAKSGIQFDDIKASDSAYFIFLKGNGEAIISSKKSIQSQISSLQLILSRLTIEGKKFRKLDLRFDSPIIEF